MIELWVNDEKLDVPNEDISFHFSQMLFSGKIIDDYSIDFEIPRTTRNERILNPVGALYRGQIFANGIDCQIVTSGHTFNSTLQVVSIAKHLITISLFGGVLPTELGSQKLSDIIHDDETTIFDFPSAIASQALTPAQPTPTTDAGLFRFDMAKGADVLVLPSYYLPSIRVNKVMRMLSDATRIDFPTINERYFLTATNRKYSPYDMHQYIWLHTEVNGETITHYAKNGGSAFNVSEPTSLNDGNGYILTFNRDVTLQVVAEAYGEWSTLPIANQGSIARIAILNPDGTESDVREVRTTQNDLYRKSTFTMSYRKGMRVKFYSVRVLTGSGVLQRKDGDCAFYITYERVNRSDDDYNTELLPVNLGETPTSTPYFEKHSFNRIGTIVNLAEITIKDFLTAIAWQLGEQLKFENNIISFVNSNVTKEIDARIEDMKPASDALGQVTTLSDAEGRDVISIKFDNGFLATDKALYKSKFYYPLQAVGKTYASIPIYTKDEGEYFELTKIKGIPLTYALKFGANWVLGIPTPFIGGNATLAQFSKVLEIDASTFEDISAVRYVIIDGLKFAVIEGDRDVTSGETTFRALQVSI